MTSLAMDIGASKTVLRVVAKNTPATEARISYDAAMPALDILGQILTRVEHIAARHGRFKRLAIASAPVIDQSGQITSWPNRPDWQGTNIAHLLRPLVRDAIVWCDDGVAGTLADAVEATDARLLHLVLGSGVGGGLWLEGQMVFNPDFGHTEIEPNGRACICGKHGCLQAYAGGRALDDAMQSDPNFDQDAWVAIAADSIARFLAQMVQRHALDRIRFSGGLLKRVPSLLAACQKSLTEHCDTDGQTIQIALSSFADNAPLQGAVVLAGVCSPLNILDRYGARMLHVRDI